MALKAILISAGDTWVAPLTVSGVFLYEVGGGSGAAYSDNGAGRNTGGAGSAEFCGGKMVSVTPGGSYSVTIGSGGIGAIEAGRATPGGYSEFAGFKALEGGIYFGTLKTGAQSAGSGGGCGGGRAISDGDGGVWPDPVPKQEAMHYWGGGGGGGGQTIYISAEPGSSGGNIGQPGAVVSGQDGGGGSGGSIWGTTNGHAGVIGAGIRKATANPVHYGAGAGGTGAGDTGGSDGGNGAGGCVVLMWFE